MAKSERRTIHVRRELERRGCRRTGSCETDFAISITFGEGCPKAFVIQVLMPLGHLLGIPTTTFFQFNMLG
jgi:hypothetical protein